MIPESFFTWEQLGSYAGATVAVMIIVQFTKELPFISKIPTRIWAYLLSVIILVLATLFTVTKVTPSIILLCFINGVVVALAAIGGYHTVADIKAKAGGGADNGN